MNDEPRDSNDGMLRYALCSIDNYDMIYTLVYLILFSVILYVAIAWW